MHLARAAALTVVPLVLFLAVPSAEASADAAPPAAGASCIPAEKCCKVCDIGKACGKTCIQATKTCHVGRGCACNAQEVCPTTG